MGVQIISKWADGGGQKAAFLSQRILRQVSQPEDSSFTRDNSFRYLYSKVILLGKKGAHGLHLYCDATALCTLVGELHLVNVLWLHFYKAEPYTVYWAR